MANVVMVQVRLPRELVKRLDHWCVDHERTRQQAVEQFVRQGVAQIAGGEGP